MRRSTVLKLFFLAHPKVRARNPYQRGRISTIDLLALTCTDQLLLIIILFSLQKTNLLRRFIVMNLSSLVLTMVRARNPY
jgi:hypothetical protein